MHIKGLFTVLLLGIIPFNLYAQHTRGVSAAPKSKIIVTLDTSIETNESAAPIINNSPIIPAAPLEKVNTHALETEKEPSIVKSQDIAKEKPTQNNSAKTNSDAPKVATNSPAHGAAVHGNTTTHASNSVTKPIAKTGATKNVANTSANVNCKVPYPKGYVSSKGYKTIPLAGQKAYFGDMDEYVTNFTKQYLQAHNRTINAVQVRGTKSFPLMEHQLKSHNIPKELKYLAVIESALNNHAVSPAGAVGPWQLMGSTARLLGLKVTRKKDERKDWDRSTNAAAKYLSTLYDQLNDWLLVIAAYNSGPSPVQRAIEKTGSHNFWDIKPYLPRETQGHVLAFIATASIFENLNKYIGMGEVPEDVQLDVDGKPVPEAEATPVTAASAGNDKDKKTAPVAVKSPYSMEELEKMCIIEISEPLSMELIAQELNIDLKLLNKWNPDYQLFVYNTYPSKDYKLRIPKDKLENFVKQKDHLEKRSRQLFKELTM